MRTILALACLLAASTAQAAPTMASGGGFTLSSVSVDLPTEGRPYPGAGPAAEAMNANCASCHSAGMVLTQPHLSRATWTEEVNKMRTVYKAPVAAEDVPAIVDYLAGLDPAH